MNTIFKIKGSLKNYEWGKVGLHSTVVHLQKSAFSDFVVKDLPYAELWMGTHPSGPAVIPSLKDMELLDFIIAHPESLGKNIIDFHDATRGLPFLFKILSVNKALSIQVHPDKETALNLHSVDPAHYPDDNHKPELAIAVTDFDALCGFRPLSEIKEFLITISQLKLIIPESIFQTFVESPSEANLKLLFTALMICPEESFQSRLITIVEDFKQDIYKNHLCQSVRQLFLKISSQYPGDIGCFCLFFLNYLKLKPGEAIFLAANEPHAYLFGDCVECMACSDNVVRAGLTPKFKDVETLCSILSYKCKPGKENIFPYCSDPTDPYCKIYDPPVSEFVIDVIQLPKSCDIYSLRTIDSASILLVMEGDAACEGDDFQDNIGCGSVLFISSGLSIQIKPQNDATLFRAYCGK